MRLLAVDVGGTKVAAALVTDRGELLAKVQEPTCLEGPDAVVAQIAALARQLDPVGASSAVGAAVPAALASDGTDRVLWAPNLPGWRDVPLREMLQERLGIPACLEFDGHAAALGEWWVGAGRGYHSLASIIIGTGIGGGFIVNDALWPGRDRLAGAVGWFPLAGPDGPDHWENLAAGPAIARRAAALLAEGEPSTLEPEALTAREIFEAARGGDPLALQVVREAAVVIGQGVASVISLVNPEIVVLGGSVGQQGDLLLPTVQETVNRWAQPISASGVPIVSSALGEEASLLGAAYSAFRRLDLSGA
ncbi:MAG: ROK family protein [Anaerolineae bacterium]|nr:ROK family protein [Anaerolineae bacterium]